MVASMVDRPLVSIAIDNYNYGRFLGEAIESALRQSYPNTEVIVVDDGSTDNSRDVIASYSDRIVPVLKENGGQASAFNTGFAVSRGEIVCFLDADDRFIDSKVEQIVQVFDQHPDVEWCFHPLRLFDMKTGAVLGDTKAFPDAQQDYSARCDFRDRMRQGRLPFYVPSCSGLCFRRSLLEKILPLPEVAVVGTSDDHYLRYCSPAAAPGFFLNEQLTLQGVHGNNAVTFRHPTESGPDRQGLYEKEIMAAYFTKSKFPEMSKFTDRLFSRGLSSFWKTTYTKPMYREEYKKFIARYLSECSVYEQLKIFLMAIYQSRPWKQVYLEYFYRQPSS